MLLLTIVIQLFGMNRTKDKNQSQLPDGSQ